MALFLFLVPVISTLVGGLLALHFRKYVHVLMAGGAGILMAAAFLDLLPQAINQGRSAGLDATYVMGLALLSFLIFFVIENVLNPIASSDPAFPRRTKGRLAGALLIFHSFRDGMAIGASYAASHASGYAVAIGIAAHDLGDGLNTVILTTGGEKPSWTDYGFLLADAIAPLLGGVVALWWFSTLKDSVVLLALAAGFFIQMAASDFLPEVRRSPSSRKYLLSAVLLGSGVVCLAKLLMSSY